MARLLLDKVTMKIKGGPGFNSVLTLTEINDIYDNGLVGGGAPAAVSRSRVIFF